MHPYQHILTPVNIRGKQLRSRLIQAKCSLPPMEPETLADFYVRSARSGAAMVCVWMGDFPVKNGGALHKGQLPRRSLSMTDETVRETYRDLVRRVHAEGALASASLMDIEPADVGISDTPNWDEIPARGDYNSMLYFNKPGISRERLAQMVEDFVRVCQDVVSLGFDAVTFYMSYRASILCNSLSPVFNQRTDEYGGSTNAQRARLTLEVFRRVREACPDLIIEVQISGEDEEPGYTMEDWLEYCRLWEGLVDIIQVRGFDGSATHVSGANMAEHAPPNLRFAEAFKAAGINMLISPVGGFGDAEDIERFLAEGRTDLVSIARQFIADPAYQDKLLAGADKGDFVPCLRCNDCHGLHRCPVNPPSLVRGKTYPDAPARSKKVAVIGGGPAGMLAAAVAAERGHDVTLFEASSRLGGQLNLAAVPWFKWPVGLYRDYLIRRVNRSGARVLLSHPAQPEEIRTAGYDAVICAPGSSPKTVPVKGADAPFVVLADEALAHHETLGERVVVIGGATTGRETALHLARMGHQVTMLTRTQVTLFRDFHAQRAEEDLARAEPNFSYIEHCSVEEIGEHSLTASVKRGIPKVKLGFGGFAIPGHMSFDLGGRTWPVAQFDESNATVETVTLEYDSVVVSGGRTPNTETAEQFRDCAPEFFLVGDGVRPGDIRNGAGDAYDAAMSL